LIAKDLKRAQDKLDKAQEGKWWIFLK
jgi:hypothetical protein